MLTGLRGQSQDRLHGVVCQNKHKLQKPRWAGPPGSTMKLVQGTWDNETGQASTGWHSAPTALLLADSENHEGSSGF